MTKEMLKDQEMKAVSGGAAEDNETNLKWCEKCQAETPHDKNGKCILCNPPMDGARYRF